MANGISINKNEFKKMSQKDQNTILFGNTEDIKTTLKDFKEEFSKHTGSDKFHFKILYALLVILIVLAGLEKYINFI